MIRQTLLARFVIGGLGTALYLGLSLSSHAQPSAPSACAALVAKMPAGARAADFHELCGNFMNSQHFAITFSNGPSPTIYFITEHMITLHMAAASTIGTFADGLLSWHAYDGHYQYYFRVQPETGGILKEDIGQHTHYQSAPITKVQ